jgi:tetratricopeptide (TPR) repeat protein
MALGALVEVWGPHSATENERESIGLYKEALEVLQKQGAPDLIAEAWIGIGNGYRNLGELGAAENFQPAIDAYQHAIDGIDPKTDRSRWLRAMMSMSYTYARIPGVDDDAALRSKACAVTQATIDALTDEKMAPMRASLLTSLSWFQLVSKDFAAALATTERYKGPDYLPIETNRAHALLLLGRMRDARAIYLKYVGQDVMGSGPWEKIILQDFDSLEKKGLGTPEMAKIRAELVAQSTSRPVARSR